MITITRRTVSMLLGATLAACGTSDASAPAASPSDTGVTSEASLPPRTSPLMAVAGDLVSGQEFAVVFSGVLTETRGGYLWVQRRDGTNVALLRSDGNSEIEMGYDLEPETAIMLDDALRGETATFVLPPELSPGRYGLCTANSLPEACIDVDVLAG